MSKKASKDVITLKLKSLIKQIESTGADFASICLEDYGFEQWGLMIAKKENIDKALEKLHAVRKASSELQ